jgi:hypothetical protein
MSRPELADLVNAAVHQATDRPGCLDAPYIGKLERGEVRWPGARYREALRTILNAGSDHDLGFRPYAVTPDVPATDLIRHGINDRHDTAVDRSPQPPPEPVRYGYALYGQIHEQSPALDLAMPAYSGPGATHASSVDTATDGPERRLMAGTDETFDFLTQAERSESRTEVIGLLRATVKDLAIAFPTEATALVDRLLEAQRVAFRLLDSGATRPDHDRDIYFLAAVTSGLLARAAVDLGQPTTATIYGRAAYLCADRSGYPPLRAWVRTEQARNAYWSDAPAEALRYLTAADTTGQRGTVAALVAASRARVFAALGHAEHARQQIAQASEIRDRHEADDLDLLGGQLAFARESQLFVASDALALLPADADSESAAAAAVDAMAAASRPDIPFGNRAGAHSNLALARVRRGDVDGAREALAPVLALPPDQRIHSVRTLTRRVRQALGDPRHGNTAQVRTAVAELEAFYSVPDTRRLPG